MHYDDTIAAAIHETWRALSHQQGWKMLPHLDQPYPALAEPDKEDNRAAARRMAKVLAAAGLALTPNGPAVGQDVLESRIETLAEAEHNGWMEHRAATGWTYGEKRDDAAKRHPSMIPYAALSDSEKEKDRNNVRHYPEFAARAGLCITSAA
jgi:RyR domain